MDNIIKVKINYHPVNFMQIALWIMILFAVPCFWLASYSDSFSLLFLGFAVMILMAVEHRLNDTFSPESFAAALDSDSGTNIPLIQLYRFLAERMPDKAKGYVKQEKNAADI